MVTVADSPPLLNSSEDDDDDFALYLEGDLLHSSASSDFDDVQRRRIKRRKVESVETHSSSHGSACPHPGEIAGMCIRCGQNMDAQTRSHGSTVPFGYIHKDLRLANHEVNRLRDRDLKSLLRRKKLYLVLDLDHTLLNSTRFMDITPEEDYLLKQGSSSLFRLDLMRMFTKLRPSIRTFLKEASSLFEMYIYTMGDRSYALEMANLLDPGKNYFESRVIAQGDCTQRHQKGLDVVLGQESAVLILDDTESVWSKHKDNLILMERYHFFASSCRQFGFQNCKSLSELKSDECEVDGALAHVLQVLKRVHALYFDPEVKEDDLMHRDVRQTLKAVRRKVLDGCKLVFTRVFPTHAKAEDHPIWKMAEQLGATCTTEVDHSVTHVVSTDAGTEKSRWALKENRFLVNTRWIEAANYFWQRQPEEKFPVIAKQVKHRSMI